MKNKSFGIGIIKKTGLPSLWCIAEEYLAAFYIQKHTEVVRRVEKHHLGIGLPVHSRVQNGRIFHFRFSLRAAVSFHGSFRHLSFRNLCRRLSIGLSQFLGGLCNKARVRSTWRAWGITSCAAVFDELPQRNAAGVVWKRSDVFSPFLPSSAGLRKRLLHRHFHNLPNRRRLHHLERFATGQNHRWGMESQLLTERRMLVDQAKVQGQDWAWLIPPIDWSSLAI